MRRRLHEKLRATVAPVLVAGESIEATGRARVGRASLGENLSLGAASAILSGGDSEKSVHGTDVFIVLTERRILVLGAHWLTFGPTRNVVESLSRPVGVTNVQRGFMTSFVVSSAEKPGGLRLSFPRTERRDAEAMLARLGAPSA
jgi:hypothetical protein